MSKPKRIRRRRSKGWRMPPDAIYVGRPTKWGNSVRIDPKSDFAERMVAVNLYKRSLLRGDLPFSVEDVRRELAGKNLACWCLESAPCHADILLEIANKDDD